MLQGGLNTGHYDLDTPSAELVEAILNILSSYLQSNQGVSLDDSFFIKLRVLSLAHVEEKVRRGVMTRSGPWEKQEYVGCGPSLLAKKYPNSRWFNDSPLGYEGKENAFSHQCLLFALTLALAKFKKIDISFEKLTARTARSLKNKTLLKTQIGKKVEETISWLCQKLFLTKQGPHSMQETIRVFTEKFKIGVIVHKWPNMLKTHFEWPLEFDADLPYFRLVLEEKGQGFHVTSVINGKTFRSVARGYSCQACKKHIKNEKTVHRCKIWKTCFGCHRFRTKKEEGPYVNTVCKSSMENIDEFTMCEKCNVFLFSSNCAIFHKKVCGLKFHCLECGRVIYRNKHSSLEKLKEYHKKTCQNFEKECFTCFETYTGNEKWHQCVLNMGRMQTEWNRVGFLGLLRQNEDVLIAHMIIEHARRGHFIQKLELNWQSPMTDKKQDLLFFNYQPQEFDVPLCDNNPKANFNQPISDGGWFSEVTQRMEDNKNSLLPHEKILLWFFQSPNSKNVTVLTVDPGDIVSIKNNFLCK